MNYWIYLSNLLVINRLFVTACPLQNPGGTTGIVGGVEVTPHSLPYQVGLLIDDVEFCGGVLVSSKYVLTAAHCVYNETSIQVILGAHDLNYKEDTQIISTNPTVIIHENYDKDSRLNDIALLKLNKYVKLTAEIEPIENLADDTSGDFLGSTGLLSGWGYTSHTGSLQERLRKVNLDVVLNSICSAVYDSETINVTESQLCTCGLDSITGEVGACFGDSGGPLVVGSTLVGLVSFGHEICEGGHPTVFTRISYFRDWISTYSGI